MNTDLLKKYNLGVDGTLQMSFQLAYYRMFGENGLSPPYAVDISLNSLQ